MSTEVLRKTIRFKILTPVYKTLTLNEEFPEYLNSRSRVCSAQDVFHLFRHLVRIPREVFYCLHLDSKNRIICIDQVSQGSLTASIVHPRELFAGVILSAAAAIILLHQHPSGDPTPSREDIEITGRLKECAELLGVRLLDHVILGDGEFVSLADRGVL